MTTMIIAVLAAFECMMIYMINRDVKALGSSCDDEMLAGMEMAQLSIFREIEEV